MSEKRLFEASEDDFLEMIRARIREKGRSCIIEAIINEDDGDLVLGNEHDNVMNSIANTSDDSDESGDDEEGGDVADDDNDSVDSLGSLENNGDKVKIHDRINHDHVHCPPFPDMSSTFRGAPHGICDCEDFCLAQCFQDNDFEFLKNCAYPIRFDDLYTLAVVGVDNERRRPNNEIRKYYYSKLFIALDFGRLEKGERRRLPNCGVAKIRQLHPSESGFYMGFKES